MKEDKKNTFICYKNWVKQISKLSLEQRGLLFTAIFHNVNGMELPEMDAMTDLVYDFMMDSIDYNTKKWNDVSEARAEAGRKGGAPKGNQNALKSDVEDDSENKQNKQKQAKTSKNKQKQAKTTKNKHNVNVNDTVNESGNVNELANENESVTVKGNGNVIVAPVGESINYQEIVDMYNETCVSFPEVKTISESRKKAIKARRNFYSIDDFQEMFEKAECSDFLKGKNDRNWRATFDWMIKDSNMAKILEGNYDNRDRKSVYDNMGGWADA